MPLDSYAELMGYSRTPLNKINKLKRVPTTDFALNMRTKFTGAELPMGFVGVDFVASTFTNNGYWSDIWRSAVPYGGGEWFLTDNGTIKSGDYLFIFEGSLKETEITTSTMKKAYFQTGWTQGSTGSPFSTRDKYYMHYDPILQELSTNNSRAVFLKRSFSSDTRLQFTSTGSSAKFNYVTIIPLYYDAPDKEFTELCYTLKNRIKHRQSYYWCKDAPSQGAFTFAADLPVVMAESYADNQVGNEWKPNETLADYPDQAYHDVQGNMISMHFETEKPRDQDYGFWLGFSGSVKYDGESAIESDGFDLVRNTVRGSLEAPQEFYHNAATRGGTARNYIYGYYIKAFDYVDISNINPASSNDLTKETFVSPYRYGYAPLIRDSFYFKTKRKVNVSSMSLDFEGQWKTSYDSTFYDFAGCRWDRSSFNGNYPRVAIITVQTPTDPLNLERVHMRGGYAVTTESPLPSYPIGVGNWLTGLITFRYPETRNIIDGLPRLQLDCLDGVLPAMEIEMHVLEWHD